MALELEQKRMPAVRLSRELLWDEIVIGRGMLAGARLKSFWSEALAAIIGAILHDFERAVQEMEEGAWH